MTDLAGLIDRLAGELRDAANAEWSEAELTAHLRRALGEVGAAWPRRAFGVIATVEGERSYALDELDGLVAITRIIYPYDPAAPNATVCGVPWRLSADGTLALIVEAPPKGDGADDIAVWYLARHAIEDLDGATATTLPPEAEGIVVDGAAGYAVEQLALSLVGAVTVDDAPARYAAWAAARLARYRQALVLAAANDALRAPEDARIAWGGEV